MYKFKFNISTKELSILDLCSLQHTKKKKIDLICIHFQTFYEIITKDNDFPHHSRNSCIQRYERIEDLHPDMVVQVLFDHILNLILDFLILDIKGSKRVIWFGCFIFESYVCVLLQLREDLLSDTFPCSFAYR